jgi:hypothetical protein
LRLPDGKKLVFTESGGRVRFDPPPPELFHIFKVVYGQGKALKTGLGFSGNEEGLRRLPLVLPFFTLLNFFLDRAQDRWYY